MYSVIDIESNGAAFRKENIIEIAIYRYDGHEIVDQFISLVNPQSEITPFVQKLTKITPKMVKTAPKFHEIAKRVVEITCSTTLVGHNIEFDYRMLRQEFKRLGYDFKINTLDTIPLAKKLIPEEPSYSLGKLVKSLGIPLTEHHRAGGDARATLDLFKLLIIKDKDSEIIQSQHEETNAKTYLNKVRDLTQDLPAERGLIYFQNSEGKIIHSDFVEDFSRHAKSVLSSKSVRYEEIQEHTEQINYELTGHDLIAKLILKSKGIHKKENLQFGLYHRNKKFIVEKNKLNPDEKPVVKFKSFTQGTKALSYINSKPEFQDLKFLTDYLNLKNRNELWTGHGRIKGEKSFIILQKGKPTGFGFFELHHQIQTMDKISKLKIDVNFPTFDLQNEMKLSLLRGDFEILPVPQ